MAITVSPVVATSGAATQAEHGGDEPPEAARSAPTSTRAAAVGAVLAGAVFLAVLLNGHLSLLQRPPAAEDFFDVQAHSLLHLRWDVPRSALFIEGFLVHGKIYEYFGPFPVRPAEHHALPDRQPSTLDRRGRARRGCDTTTDHAR